MMKCSVLNDTFSHQHLGVDPFQLMQSKVSHHVNLHHVIVLTDISSLISIPYYRQSIPLWHSRHMSHVLSLNYKHYLTSFESLYNDNKRTFLQISPLLHYAMS